MVDVTNRDAVETITGGWPSFHDAEVIAVRLSSGQQDSGVARLELDIHLPARPDAPDGLSFPEHLLVSIEFRGLTDVHLVHFGPQNVLWDLELKERSLAGERGVQVELPSSNGLEGSFWCREVVVLDASVFKPGPFSVYH